MIFPTFTNSKLFLLALLVRFAALCTRKAVVEEK